MTERRRYTMDDVRRGYTAEKRRREWYGEWGAALIYRPISLLLTPILLRRAVSASAVTLAALGLALLLPVGAAALGGGAYLFVGFGALAVAVLDCVDGNIARATGSESARGDYLDFVTDIVFRTAAYGAVGLIAAAEDGWGLPLAVLAALLAIAARLCRLYAEGLTGEGVTAPPAAETGIVGRYLYPLLSGLDPLLPFAILAAGYWQVMGWLLVWLVAYSALDLLYTNTAILRRLA
jgi:phosphatidylglycerophosphate synthase